MIIAIHQPNFIPWFPFFEKMALADRFVIMKECQFEKNGYQNRARVNDRWWTNPVNNGKLSIRCKSYTTGQNLLRLNLDWIETIAKTLMIDTAKIRFDHPTDATSSYRLIEICKRNEATGYLTNPDAFDKYLHKEVFAVENINIVPFRSKHPKHIFEMFHEHGIEGTRNILVKTVEEFNKEVR